MQMIKRAMKKNKAVQGDTEYQTERGQQLHILWSRKASLRRRHLNTDLNKEGRKRNAIWEMACQRGEQQVQTPQDGTEPLMHSKNKKEALMVSAEE